MRVLLRIGFATLASAAALAHPGTAGAAVVTATISPGYKAEASGHTQFAAAPGERNTVTVRQDRFDVVIADATAVLQPGSGCQSEGSGVVRCRGAGIAGVRLDLGDGDPDDAPAPDRYEGGPGSDGLSFPGRRRGVRVDLGAGRTGDGDLLADVERVNGGLGDDVLAGTDERDSLYGAAGDDVLVGRGGPDRLAGASGADGIDGGHGDDELDGGSGADQLTGGTGTDHLDPSQGGAEVRGEDRTPIRRRARARDVVRCDEGLDTVRSPELVDRVSPSCELIGKVDDRHLAGVDVPLRPQAGPTSRVLVYRLRLSSGPRLARVRLEIAHADGRVVGRSEAVRFGFPDSADRKIRVRLRLRRGANRLRGPGWRLRVRIFQPRSRTTGTAVVPTRPAVPVGR